GHSFPRNGPAAAGAQTIGSRSAPDHRATRLWPLDTAGAAGRGQCGHAALSRRALMAVTGFQITLRRPLAGGAPFGDAGSYEELKGRLHYAVDPTRPIDVGAGFLLRRGYVVASCGWQFDLPDVPGLIRLYGAQAREHGQPLRGRVYVQLQAPEDVTDFLLSDRAHQAYPAADLDERDATLTVRDMPDAEPEVIPRARWTFARVVNGRVTPDPHHVWLEDGFAKGRLYHLAYTGTGAQVVGLGLVALRDCAAWLKGAEAPARARWVYAYGRSQT